MILFAWRMLRLLDELGKWRALKLEIWIGIHPGPLVSGVISSTKTVCDVWGDPVNVASRIESHGRPGRIQVSTERTSSLSGIVFSDLHTVGMEGIGHAIARFVVAATDPQ